MAKLSQLCHMHERMVIKPANRGVNGEEHITASSSIHKTQLLLKQTVFLILTITYQQEMDKIIAPPSTACD